MSIVFTRFPYESAYGGEEYHTITLATYMQKQGVDVTFFGSCVTLTALCKKHDLAAVKVYYPPAPVTPLTLLIFVITLPILWPYIAVKFLHSCRKNTTTLYALGLPDKLLLTPMCILLGIRVVWIEHQLLGNWLLQSPLRLWYTYLSRKVRIIPVSYRNSQTLLHALRVPPSSLAPITHGVDTDFFVPNTIHQSPNQLFYNGRLTEEKGIRILLQAFVLLYNQNSNVHLHINGTGPLMPVILECINTHSLHANVRITGHLTKPELLRAYQTASVFILPSLTDHETFGLVAAEALSSGAVAVVTTACGIAHTLPADLQQYVVEPTSITQLLQCIQRALQSPYNPQQLHDLAVKYYNQQHMLQQYQQLLCTT
jgi:glycosyltransferase involved in cell wall biosynthesis